MLYVADIARSEILALLNRYGIELVLEADGSAITGSFWGDSEAGIVGSRVYVRNDTPIHSLLHEAAHIVCMTAARRAGLDKDAGGDDLEEAAVCYLQVILADELDGVGREQLMSDMDAWGYSFRLGSTREWFRRDAEDAKGFLINHGLLSVTGQATFVLRDT